MSVAECSKCGFELPSEDSSCPRCDISTVENDFLELKIPGHKIISLLGRRGMGAVYLAEDTTLGRRVAIKILSETQPKNEVSYQRFLRETRNMATLEHPRIVRIYSFGYTGAHPYLVMEYVEGETLADYLRSNGRLSLAKANSILTQIIDGLEAASEKKIVHRDIKPSNILIDRKGEIRVADFGLAKTIGPAEDALKASGGFVGTPHYVAPEQILGRTIDQRTDIYSLG